MIDRSRWREELRGRLIEERRDPNWACITVRDGWKDLICDMVDRLDATGIEWHFTCVKEKLGGLCVYVEAEKHPSLESILNFTNFNGKLDEFLEIIAAAEAASLAICENCGRPGELRNVDHLLVVACGECYLAEKANRGMP